MEVICSPHLDVLLTSYQSASLEILNNRDICFYDIARRLFRSGRHNMLDLIDELESNYEATVTHKREGKFSLKMNKLNLKFDNINKDMRKLLNYIISLVQKDLSLIEEPIEIVFSTHKSSSRFDIMSNPRHVYDLLMIRLEYVSEEKLIKCRFVQYNNIYIKSEVIEMSD